jgi:hypothetical protein
VVPPREDGVRLRRGQLGHVHKQIPGIRADDEDPGWRHGFTVAAGARDRGLSVLATMMDVDDETEGSQYRRLPPRIRPTGTEHDVSPPAPVREVREVNGLSPAGGVEAAEQVADYLTSTPRGSWRRTALLVVLGVGILAFALYQVM